MGMALTMELFKGVMMLINISLILLTDVRLCLQ